MSDGLLNSTRVPVPAGELKTLISDLFTARRDAAEAKLKAADAFRDADKALTEITQVLNSVKLLYANAKAEMNKENV